MRRLALALALAASAAAASDLPPPEEALQALAQHPAVLAARAGVRERDAGRRVLEAGPHELTVRGGAANRQDRLTGQDSRDLELGLERAFRSGAKAELDARLGAQGVAQAEAALGDALHEAGRELLQLWFEWLRAAQEASDWQAQAALLADQRQVVEKRVRAGDAPRQELLLADSAMAQAESQHLQARARAEAAAGQLARRFPGIRIPAEAPPASLVPLEGGLERWRARVLEHNHELAVARAEQERLRTAVRRAEADRIPDPTVGVRLASERGGDERILGLTFAIPLPGQARAAAVDRSAAELDAALQREALVLRRREGEIAALFSRASRSFEAARRAQEAAQGLQRNAELSQRAYALGEVALADVLVARRLAIESRLVAALARLDAAESRYRLMLDAHELWAID